MTTNGAVNPAYSNGRGDEYSLPSAPTSIASSRKSSTTMSAPKSVKRDLEEAKWGLINDDDDSSSERIPWKDLTNKERGRRVLIDIGFYGLRLTLLAGLFYLFVCALKILTSAFRLLGGKTTRGFFSQTSLLANPVCGLMVGVLVTVIVQSSSTSTSIFIAIVAARVVSVMHAIPMIMGANIGTSVTNTIVSMGQYTDRDVFRRSFAGATVHDMFNWMSVLVLLPLEIVSHYLYHLSNWLVTSVLGVKQSTFKAELLDAIIKPLTKKIVQIDKSAITDVTTDDNEDVRVLKVWCDDNKTVTCNHLFASPSISDSQAGLILLIISLVLLITCLIGIVKVLHSTLKGRIGKLTKKFINTDLPGVLAFLTGYIAIFVGAILTFLVQSSSIFTSALTPLVGIGMITVDRMYPLTLGANIGTTATGIIAALSVDGDNDIALQLALCHLFFNISGIVIWYPIPILRNVPVRLAKKLGDVTSSYRWFSIFYLICMFFLFPLIIFALSLVGLWLLLVVLIPTILLIVFIVVVNILQSKRPHWLPELLRDWTLLPFWMRSLKPLDRKVTQMKRLIAYSAEACWRKSKQLFKPQEDVEGFGFAEHNLPAAQSDTESTSTNAISVSSTLNRSHHIENGDGFMSYL